jgi:signal transduction histidine kinase
MQSVCQDRGDHECVGIASMRERVEQIGGTLDIGAGASGGRVKARLPVAAASIRNEPWRGVHETGRAAG